MPARFVRAVSAENVSTTLSSGITDVATTMTVASASSIVAPCYLVIDRVDSAGTQKSTSLWEYVYVSNVSGSDLTITRAQGGSTGQSHSAGAVVEATETAAAWEDARASYVSEHTNEGVHASLASTTYIRTIGLVVTSVASISQLNTGAFNITDLAVSSTASVRILNAATRLNASGASVTGFPLVVTNTSGSIASVQVASSTYVAVMTVALGFPYPGRAFLTSEWSYQNPTDNLRTRTDWRIVEGSTALAPEISYDNPDNNNGIRASFSLSWAGFVSPATVIFTLQGRGNANATPVVVFQPRINAMGILTP